jgi:hypothetical protein
MIKTYIGKHRGALLYVGLSMLYMLWLGMFPISSLLNSTIMGKLFPCLIAILLQAKIPPTAWQISYSSELMLALRGPGIYIGFIIGYSQVRNWKHILKGLIPSAYLLTLFSLVIFVPQGVWLLYPAAVQIFVTAIPYCIVGAALGWALAVRRAKTIVIGGIITLIIGSISSPAIAYGPHVGHRTIVNRAIEILDAVSPGQFDEIDNHDLAIEDGAEQEDGLFLNDAYGLRGPMHFHNPITSRPSKGLNTEGIGQFPIDAIDVAVGLWQNAISAYNSNENGVSDARCKMGKKSE